MDLCRWKKVLTPKGRPIDYRTVSYMNQTLTDGGDSVVRFACETSLLVCR
jgi:hypothetical protein